MKNIARARAGRAVRLAPALVALLVLSTARAQEPEVTPGPPRPVPVTAPRASDDVQREMIELFGKVERELLAIDRLLQEAARAPGAASGGSVAEQLRNAQSSGQKVQEGIDRILELAASQPPSSSSSSSGGEPSSEGQSPMDNQGEQSTGREATPSAPQSGGEKPEPGGQEQQPGGEQEKPGSNEKPGDQGREKSDDPKGSKAQPHQTPGSDPKAGAAGSSTPPNDARDRWGDLPFHAREVFRNEGGRDMPPLYREWIDAYYKRLNKQP